MRRTWTGCWLLLLASTALAGPTYAPATLEYYFRLEWQVTQSAGGSSTATYNKSAMTADRMQLRIDELDAAGKIVAPDDLGAGRRPAEQSRLVRGARAPGRELSRGDHRVRLDRARRQRRVVGRL